MRGGHGAGAARFAPLEPEGMAMPWLWIGTWSMGGIGYGRADLGESEAVLGKAFEAGVRHFDTAGFYARGRSEALIARALGAKRRAIFIATKGGLRWEGNRVRHAASPEALRLALEESLARLKTDYIDLYQLHWPDPAVPLPESIDALKALKGEGLIRFFGACNLDGAEISSALEPGARIPHQVHYNPLHRTEHILAAGKADDRCCNCVVSPLEQGLLAGGPRALGKRDVRRRNPYFKDPETDRWLAELRALARTCPVPAVPLVLLWILSNPLVDVVVPGPRTERQLEALLSHASWLSRLEEPGPRRPRSWVDPLATLAGRDLWRFLESRAPIDN